jgi:amino acid adenylation domain-containing protein
LEHLAPTSGIARCFARQASLTPDAVAVATDEVALTYMELNQYSNQIAYALQRAGVKAGTLVGVCLERSPGMVASFLAILKLGAAYVPLDPTYPAERLAFMTADAKLPVIVTREGLLPQLPSQLVRHIILDADERQVDLESVEDLIIEVGSDPLAYVIYTSGTTGQPKGVMISESSLQNLVRWHQDTFGITPADRATQLAGMAFDATGWELWPYLTLGAGIYMPDETVRISPVALRDWLVVHQITVSFVSTALAEPMLGLHWPPETALRYLLTGAEALTRYPPVGLPFELINNYGPTEATVVATSGRIAAKENPDPLPPIGRAITNVQIFLLDENGKIVPQGTKGEIHIGGAGVARGYLNRPELTAERFIANPFAGDQEAGSRLYRTGDQACVLPDGQLQFLGRSDTQIKIRGYRIEPEEVSAILNRHDQVQASVVTDLTDESGEKKLVAYLVTADNTAIDRSDKMDMTTLRRHLQESLPAYMIPTLFISLASLPLTANGKVDRAALPAPNATNTLWQRSITAPTTETEERLAPIVAEILGLPEVGMDENFFFLGGHSFLGTQLIARISSEFGIELPLRAIFDAPTVHQLALTVETSLLAAIAAMSEEEVRQSLESPAFMNSMDSSGPQEAGFGAEGITP